MKKPSRAGRERLDNRIVADGLACDLTRARALILAGQVLVDDTPISTAGAQVKTTSEVRLRSGANRDWASRGALKLAPALDVFSVAVAGRTCLDIGASTGGFTDVLLKRDATRVFAVDVGYGQLIWRVRNDPRVTVLDRTNARHLTLEMLDSAAIDLVVADVSFISLTRLVAPVAALLAASADVLLMVKPQFEVLKPSDAPNGVVVDPEIREAAVNRVVGAASQVGLDEVSRTANAVHGPSGNVETFVHFRVATR